MLPGSEASRAGARLVRPAAVWCGFAGGAAVLPGLDGLLSCTAGRSATPSSTGEWAMAGYNAPVEDPLARGCTRARAGVHFLPRVMGHDLCTSGPGRS
ncbi:hypothetical protein QJS66_15200 [Kocuria rhizophila]|nr:hypothetical protein QJS66_15200 [Kocuria rhizophila]